METHIKHELAKFNQRYKWVNFLINSNYETHMKYSCYDVAVKNVSKHNMLHRTIQINMTYSCGAQ